MSFNPDDENSQFDAFHLDAIADADPYPYWYDDADEPDSNPTLVRSEICDLCVVGGGYNGLWTAIIAKERDPSRDVILIEAHEVGSAASGRNGGFMESSLTHGVANGQERFPDELPLLEELGLKNLNDIEAAIKRYNIDCDYERTGVIDIATEFHSPSYLDELRDDYTQLRSLGQKVEWLDKAAMQAQVNSPTYTGGLWRKDRAAIVDPGGDLDRVLPVLEQEGLQLERILLTHAHLDHAAATAELARRTGAPIEGPNEGDRYWIEQLPEQARRFGLGVGENFVGR